MKKKIFAALLTLVMIVSLLSTVALAARNPFTDVSTADWYYDEVMYANDEGLMTGTSGSSFEPNAPTSRAMIWTILARMDGVKTGNGGLWYERARVWAIENGISDGSNPNGLVTREQVAAMLYRYGARRADASKRLNAFSDAADVSDYAYKAMKWAVGTGILSGTNGKLLPQDTATRAQVAAMLYRFCNYDLEDEEIGDILGAIVQTHRHNYDYKVTVIKAATCTEKGEELHECVCGERYTKEISVDSSAHDYTESSGTYSCGCGAHFALPEGMTDVDNVVVVVNGVGYTSLSDGFTQVAEGAAQDYSIEIIKDISLLSDWTTIHFANRNVTVNGGKHTISGLTKSLFHFYGGTFAVKNLTIADSNVTGNTYIQDGVEKNELGLAALIEVAQWVDLTVENCHVKNTTVADGDYRAAALVGYLAGGGEIKNCSVSDCEVEAAGSVAGILGHEQRQTDTGYLDYIKLTGCSVTNTDLTSTDNGGWRVGTMIGTIAGKNTIIKNCTASGYTLAQTGKTAPGHDSYGRIAGGSVVTDTAAYVTTATELTAAIDSGVPYIRLDEDVAYNNNLYIYGSENNPKEITLDLNGHDFSGNTTGQSGAIRAEGSVTLTITGTGSVKARDSVVMASDGAKVIINGGAYESVAGAVGLPACATNGLLHARRGGEIVVNGGTFKDPDAGSGGRKTLNVYDSAPGTITLNGGSFYKFNPCVDNAADNYPIEDDGVNYGVKFGEGYSATADGDWYTVSK